MFLSIRVLDEKRNDFALIIICVFFGLFVCLSDQHLEICSSDGVSPCESNEYSADHHDLDAGNGSLSLVVDFEILVTENHKRI